MCERPQKSRSAPKFPYICPFPGVQKCRKNNNTLEFLTLFCPQRSGSLPDSPWLVKELLIIIYNPFQRPCPLPRRTPRVLNTSILKKKCQKQMPQYSHNIPEKFSLLSQQFLVSTGRIFYSFMVTSATTSFQ